METRAPDTRHESVTSEAQLLYRQSIVVSLPRDARLVVSKGALQLTFVAPSLDWLGEPGPAIQITLLEGQTYIIERSCHATLYGAKAGMTVIHFEAPAALTLLTRIRAWAARRAPTARTRAMSRKVR